MDKPKIIFILNPTAGKGKSIEKNVFIDKFSDRQVEFIECFEERDDILLDYLAQGVLDFVAVGGDGTVNDIGSVLMNTNARMGVIPIGSGNGLARELGIPLDIEEALEVIARGKVRKIDVGLLNEKPFFCTAGIGFDAVCAYEFASRKHNRGFWNYVKIAFESYFAYIPVVMDLNGEKGEFFSVTFANAKQFGNNAYIAPKAKIDDGLLDCSILLPHPKAEAFEIASSLMTKRLFRSKYYKSTRGAAFFLENISDNRLHLDGEFVKIESKEIRVSVLSKALNVIV